MKLKEDVKSVTYLKDHAALLLDQLNKTRRPVVITQNGSARAVIQDAKTFEQMWRALSLFKLIAKGEADAECGRVRNAGEVFRRLCRELKSQDNS